MAVLSTQDRVELMARFMSELVPNGETLSGVVKSDLQAAINAVDDWVNTNAAAFNTAIPQPARSALSTRQKAMILMYVVRRRFEVG